MTACGKHGKTIKLFSHASPSPWKSLRRFPHYHRHGYDEDEYLSKPVQPKPRTMMHNITTQVGQIKWSKWATPEERTQMYPYRNDYRPLTSLWRAVVEVALTIFLFCSILFMSEFTFARHLRQRM